MGGGGSYYSQSVLSIHQRYSLIHRCTPAKGPASSEWANGSARGREPWIWLDMTIYVKNPRPKSFSYATEAMTYIRRWSMSAGELLHFSQHNVSFPPTYKDSILWEDAILCSTSKYVPRGNNRSNPLHDHWDVPLAQFSLYVRKVGPKAQFIFPLGYYTHAAHIGQLASAANCAANLARQWQASRHYAWNTAAFVLVSLLTARPITVKCLRVNFLSCCYLMKHK